MPERDDPNRPLINPLTGQPVLSAEEVAEVTEILEEWKANPEKKAADLAAAERRERSQEMIQSLLEAGYRRNPDKEGELVHPDDPEKTAWYDPYTHELLLSPKLQEALRELADKSKQTGGGKDR